MCVCGVFVCVLSPNVIIFVLMQQSSVRYQETWKSNILILYLLLVVSQYDTDNGVLRIVTNKEIYGLGICCFLLLLSMILRIGFIRY